MSTTTPAPKGGSVLGHLQADWESAKHLLSFSGITAEISGAATNAITNTIANAAKKEFDDVKAFVLNGHWSTQVLGFLAGVGMAVAGLYSALDDFLNLDLLQAVFDVFVLGFGALMAALEYKDGILPANLVKELKEEFLFIYKPYGRAILYIFFGTLLFSELWSQESFVYGLVGLYTLVVGFMVFYFAQQAEASLKKLKAARLDKTKVKTLFNKADKKGTGFLNTESFAVLCKALGAELNHNELESALLELDGNHDGKISWDEFWKWYEAQ